MFVRKASLWFCFLCLILCGCARLPQREALYQVSVISGLLAGDYDGSITLQQLSQHGDFGLGTFQGLDGELVALDGKFYQVKADGAVRLANRNLGIPFAQVTFFDLDQTYLIAQELDYAQLKKYLDARLPSQNVFYAIKISGQFKYVKARSVPKQIKPYPKLEEALGQQKVFEWHMVRGSIVGWRSPEYAQGFSVGGYHLHFISQDRLRGGHLLDCVISNVQVLIDATYTYDVALPAETGFLGLQLNPQVGAIKTGE